MKTVIIGGVAGGASAAARLRRLDEEAEIIIFERGEYISFANCGLPYYIGEKIREKSALTLQTPESFNARFNIEVRAKSEVVGIDRENKKVKVKSGEKEYFESYDKLILSMGAEPIRPNLPGLDCDKVFTIRSIPDTLKVKSFVDLTSPKSAVVVGGGYIGIEMAENLRAKGLEVSIVEMGDQVIAPLDYDMACAVHNHIREKGVKLYLGNGLKSVEKEGGKLVVNLTEGQISTDLVVLAIGVRPETKIAIDAGIICNQRGGITVDEHMTTSDPDIYAVGDAVEVIDFVTGDKAMIALAGPANKQGRIAADNIIGIKSSYKKTQGSAILKVFDLAVATTGINEKTAIKAGIPYEKSFTVSASHATYYPGAKNMTIKLLFNKENGLVLGVQIVGYEGVDKRCDVFATAIRAKMTVYDLTELELCYAPPFSSAKDPVNMAGYVAENILTKKVNVVHWHEIENLRAKGNVTFIDVRTGMEHQGGAIDGFEHIPLDALRKNIERLDKSKKIVVSCQSGLRSYIASRILKGHGFDVHNLSGGYSLYSTIEKDKKA